MKTLFPSKRLGVVIWIFWMGFCLALLFGDMRVISDLTAFLPNNKSLMEQVLLRQMREGPASRMVLVGLGNQPEESLASCSKALQSALTKVPGIVGVENGQHLPDVLRQLESQLFHYQYLLSPDIDSDLFSRNSLVAALAHDLDVLRSPASSFEKKWLLQDPLGLWIHLLRDWLWQKGPDTQRGVWFSGDHSRALLLIKTQAAGFDVERQAALEHAVEVAYSGLPDCHGSSLQLGGVGPLSLRADELTRGDAEVLSLLNTCMVLVLLFLVYRSPRLLILGSLPLATGLLTGVAVVIWFYGSVHAVSLAFGATLLGVAADYPNHFFSHLDDHPDSPERTLRSIWPTLRLGILTNILGFSGMFFSGFEGLAQIAILASSGLAAAGMTTRYVVPSFLPKTLPGFCFPKGFSHLFESMMGHQAARWIPFLFLFGAIAFFTFSGAPLWNDDIESLSPVPPKAKQATEAMQIEMGVPDLRSLILIQGQTESEVLERSEQLLPILDRLVLEGKMGGYDAISHYLPSQATQIKRLQSLPHRQVLESDIRWASNQKGFTPNAFQAFLDLVDQSRQLSPIDSRFLAQTVLNDRVQNLLIQLDQGWVGLVPLYDIKDPRAIPETIEQLNLPSIRYADLKEASSKMLAHYRLEALSLLALSGILIYVVLSLGLGSSIKALRVLVPMLLASGTTACVMAVLFSGLNLFHLVSLMLVMGLSLDQALFFQRASEHREERIRTMQSLLVCSLSSILAFGSLALSSTNVLKSIGGTISIGAMLAILFAAAWSSRDMR
jgi:predicted exporter